MELILTILATKSSYIFQNKSEIWFIIFQFYFFVCLKNRQRKTKNKDSSIQNQTIEANILPKGTFEKRKNIFNFKLKEKTNEIEQYFLKRVGDVSRSKLNTDYCKPNNSETIDKTKVQKSEFDLINQ